MRLISAREDSYLVSSPINRTENAWMDPRVPVTMQPAMRESAARLANVAMTLSSHRALKAAGHGPRRTKVLLIQNDTHRLQTLANMQGQVDG